MTITDNSQKIFKKLVELKAINDYDLHCFYSTWDILIWTLEQCKEKQKQFTSYYKDYIKTDVPYNNIKMVWIL